jgi:hypothetical protein
MRKLLLLLIITNNVLATEKVTILYGNDIFIDSSGRSSETITDSLKLINKHAIDSINVIINKNKDTIVTKEGPWGLYCRLFTGTGKISCTLPASFRSVPITFADSGTVQQTDFNCYDETGISLGALFNIYNIITLGVGAYYSFCEDDYAEIPNYDGGWGETPYCDFGLDCPVVPEFMVEIPVYPIDEDYHIKLLTRISYEQFSASNGLSWYGNLTTNSNKALAQVFPINISLKLNTPYNASFEVGAKLYYTHTTDFGKECNFKTVNGIYIACSGENFFTTKSRRQPQ